MTSDSGELSVGDFYGPVLTEFPEDVQDLVLALFEGKFDTKSELVEAINAKAFIRAESEEDDS